MIYLQLPFASSILFFFSFLFWFLCKHNVRVCDSLSLRATVVFVLRLFLILFSPGRGRRRQPYHLLSRLRFVSFHFFHLDSLVQRATYIRREDSDVRRTYYVRYSNEQQAKLAEQQQQQRTKQNKKKKKWCVKNNFNLFGDQEKVYFSTAEHTAGTRDTQLFNLHKTL